MGGRPGALATALRLLAALPLFTRLSPSQGSSTKANTINRNGAGRIPGRSRWKIAAWPGPRAPPAGRRRRPGRVAAAYSQNNNIKIIIGQPA